MWKTPDITKIYEALGAVADQRLEVEGGTAKCYSSSRNKFYRIFYDAKSNSIMSNDDSSYWQGTLGYPAIAYLLHIGVLPYKKEMGDLLKGVAWKDINQQFQNNFLRALEFILKDLETDERNELNNYCESLLISIKKLQLKKLGEKMEPPIGY